MKTGVQIRVGVTEPQAQRLQERLASMPFRVEYQEEQHGPDLIVCIGCAPAQKRMVTELLQEVCGHPPQLLSE